MHRYNGLNGMSTLLLCATFNFIVLEKNATTLLRIAYKERQTESKGGVRHISHFTSVLRRKRNA